MHWEQAIFTGHGLEFTHAHTATTHVFSCNFRKATMIRFTTAIFLVVLQVVSCVEAACPKCLQHNTTVREAFIKADFGK